MNTKSPEQISIRCLRPGRYTAQYTVDGKRKSVYGETEEEVRARLLESASNRKLEGGRLVNPLDANEGVTPVSYTHLVQPPYPDRHAGHSADCGGSCC